MLLFSSHFLSVAIYFLSLTIKLRPVNMSFFSYKASLEYCFSFFWVLEFAVNCSGRSLRKQPTFFDVTNGFPTKQ